jgi:hypothetical protein
VRAGDALPDADTGPPTAMLNAKDKHHQGRVTLAALDADHHLDRIRYT